MLKEFLWETFKKTGNIEAYIFYKEIEEVCDSNVELENANEEIASTG